MKAQLKDHMESHKFFDTIKSTLSKYPELAKLDKDKIIEKMKQEGLMDDLLSTLPAPQHRSQKVSGGGLGGGAHIDVSGSDSMGGQREPRQQSAGRGRG